MITSDRLRSVFAVGYLLATVWLCRGIRLTARDLCLGGIVCAMTLVLATIRIPLPTGSNITCGSWIPLMLLALLYDYRLSMLSGWVCGILAMILIPGWQAVHWAQIFVQQLVCFSCLGYAGVFGTRQALEGHLRHGAGGVRSAVCGSCDQRCDLLFPERLGRLGRLGLQPGLQPLLPASRGDLEHCDRIGAAAGRLCGGPLPEGGAE